MNRDAEKYEQLLQREISLVDSLSESLCAARDAIVSFQIRDFEESIGEQMSLCVQLAAATAELQKVPASPGNDAMRGLREESRQARARLHKLNREHEALLHRSRRTVNAILNGFRSFEGDYAEEALKQAGNADPLQGRA